METPVTKSNHAFVGFNRGAGGPQLTPVWYAWDGTSFYFSTTKDRVKHLNLKRDPSITLIVDDFETHKYVVAYGRAEIIEQNIGELTRPIVRKYVPADRLKHSIKFLNNGPSHVRFVF